MLSIKKIQEILEKAIQNANDDRDKANSLLKDVSVYIGSGNTGISIGSDKHREVGLAASKYLDNLTKSNEGIIKASELLLKLSNKKEEKPILTDDDKKDFYETLENSNKLETEVTIDKKEKITIESVVLEDE
mgnify:CR=1 FL=1